MRAGESIEYVRAKEYVERFGGEIVRKRDGYVIVYRRVCDGSSCKRVLIWFRKSPITPKSVDFIKRILGRMGWDEIWLVRLYKEPDFTEDYKKIITRELDWKEIMEF